MFGENASLLRLFDHRFDAFAGETHQNLPPRAGVALGAGAVALMLLPWPACALWTGATLCVELWGWFAGRRQYLGLPVTAPDRGVFLIYVSVLITCWFLLGAMFWLTGRMDGVVCATIVWVSIIGFAQTFGSRSPLAFAICGVLPAIGVLSLMLAGPIGGHAVHNVAMERLPVAGIMALALGFAVAGARQTFAAGRRLEEMQAKLRDSDADYRLLADNISDVIGRLSLDGAWRYISPSIEATLGYTSEEFRALDVGEFVYADDLPAVLELVGTLTEGCADRASLEYRQIAKDGRFVWIDTSFTLARDAAGEPVEIICLSRDIDARKALEHALVEAREKAEATAAAKTDFLANMSHELRSPLNAIIGFAGVLKGSPCLTRRDARHAGLIADASDAMLVVVNDVLDFSRLESGAVELDPEPFDPLALARSVAALAEDQAATKGLRLDVIADGEISQVNGDGPRLRQVLLNLISNALKFTIEGGVRLHLAQAPAADGMTAMRIAVVDSGIGISPEKQIAVFERFNQADASVSRRFGGTGLGLAICKRIVELMGGTIGVQSREGRGSTFWFEVVLPLAAAGGAPDAECARRTGPPAAAAAGGGRRRQPRTGAGDPGKLRHRDRHGRQRRRGDRRGGPRHLRPGADGRSDAGDGRPDRRRPHPRPARSGAAAPADHRHDCRRHARPGAALPRSRHERPSRQAAEPHGADPDHRRLGRAPGAADGNGGHDRAGARISAGSDDRARGGVRSRLRPQRSAMRSIRVILVPSRLTPAIRPF